MTIHISPGSLRNIQKLWLSWKYDHRKSMTKPYMTKILKKILSMTISSMTKNWRNFQVWQKKVWPKKMAFLGYDYYFQKKRWKSVTKKKKTNVFQWNYVKKWMMILCFYFLILCSCLICGVAVWVAVLRFAMWCCGVAV